MIRPLTSSEFNQAVAFANQTFFPNRENDFLVLQPKVYRHPETFSPCHFVDETDGKIVGLVACYPVVYQGLKLLGIGTVCVDENYRNRGIMQEMFSHIDHQCSSVYSLMYLSGDKKRYEHFGFYKTGQKITFRFKKRNFEKNGYPSYSIKPYQTSDETIDGELYTIYQSKATIERDPNRFFDALKTSSYEIFLLYDQELFGYVVYDKKNHLIREIGSKAENRIAILSNLLSFLDLQEVFYEVSINDIDISKLYDQSDNYQISTLANLKIIDYVETLKTLLRQKKNLKKGIVRIKIIDAICLSIEVNRDVSVKEIPDQTDFDLVLTEKEAHILFFENPYFIRGNHEKSEIINDYFPLDLPCTISSIDSI